MEFNEDFLYHDGTKHHSGRFEYGTGEHPFQHEPWFTWGEGVNAAMVLDDPKAFYKYMKGCQESGMSEKEICEELGISTGTFRSKKTVALNAYKQERNQKILELKDKGYSNTKIAEMIGETEGTVRNVLKEPLNTRAQKTNEAAALLKEFADKNKFVDVGPGTELYLDITDTRLKSALQLLKDQGYTVQKIYVDQMGGNNQQTTMSVLLPPGVTYKELVANQDSIHYLGEKVYDADGKLISTVSQTPASVSSDRVLINYAETGGVDKDGVIELRRGVDDISLGDARYAQVRIAVDGTHYLKGMAVYADDLPDGVDIRFNTNKHEGTALKDVLKKMKDDPNNPFGATIKDEEQLKKVQRYYYDEEGKQKLSAINVVNEEGDWAGWGKKLASQFLSKQYPSVAKKQLQLTIDDAKQELEDICNITNATIKKKLLAEYAEKCESAAIDLKATAFPGQASKVIIPITDLKENEIYSPNLKNGTEVALVRYPHGGTFEIPILTVNNKSKQANSIMRNAQDAVGINSKTAQQLSGADFDGDTVTVIPLSSKVKIKATKYLDELKGFDPKESYAGYEGMKVITNSHMQTEMGVVSNLITDMTLKGATTDKIARAVKYSMVVIDAEKHKLNYQQAAKDLKINDLKNEFQSNDETGNRGASTLISRAKSQLRVLAKKVTYGINERNTDPETGEKIEVESGRTYTTKTAYSNGKEIKKGKTIISSKGEVLSNSVILDDGTIISGVKSKKNITVENGKVYKVSKDGSLEKVSGAKVEKNANVVKNVKVLNDGTVISTNLKSVAGVSVDSKGNVYKNGKKVKGSIVIKNTTVTESEPKFSTVKSTKMAETKDAYTLTSGGSKENPGTTMEGLYANFANSYKALANSARKEYLATTTPKKDPEAAKKYEKEVESLSNKLAIAQSNAPKERAAQRLANSMYQKALNNDPDMDEEHQKKKKGQCLQTARKRTGAKKETIVVTDSEWKAIQNNAISSSMLEQILNNSDADALRKRATPRQTSTMTPSMIALANSMSAAGYTQADIADRLGVSASTVSKNLSASSLS